MQPTPQQLANWNAAKNYFANQTSGKVERLILVAEIARDFQAWCDVHGVMFPTVFSAQDNIKVKEIVDTYNKILRAIDKVEQGVYGLNFVNDKIDVVAPFEMPQEEYQTDMVVGFGNPLIWLGAGALVIGGILAVAHLVRSFSETETSRLTSKIIDSAEEISEMSPELKTALAKLVSDNKDKLDKAGLLDKILGENSGFIIAGAIAAGILLFAYLQRRRD